MNRPPSPRPSRRAVLGGLGGLALGGLVSACGGTARTAEPSPAPTDVERLTYGDDDSQVVDVRRPDGGQVLGTVVLLHGGYWLPQYGLDQLDPLAKRLTSLGWVTANVEYRRTGAGGGVPATLEDVAAALDLVTTERLPGPVVTLGHSAGGHLAVWAASRSARTPGGAPRGRLAGAVSLSGVLDLDLASGRSGSSGPVRAFTGGTPRSAARAYAAADPTALVPAPCPVWAVQAEDDQVVPREQATSYVAAAREAGGTAELVLVPGDHFTVIDPDARSTATVERLLRRAAG
ncbi:alpha/beta hydrolase [Nocardioides aurantiacus]|uniref:Acetyl esterase/lipase n=1 Tax=Nocardioides aurantiacus TaxID=86796 RepID=A0A3N2CZC4_9ACTN|nr:alpha/beta hydrolase [Nocardioides aurantiacus]ROR92895.1 acetyl esterase/lipase [Nocardioides aurantiacus]